jgi:hypothetical protein
MLKVGDSGVFECGNFRYLINCIGVETELLTDCPAGKLWTDCVAASDAV